MASSAGYAWRRLLVRACGGIAVGAGLAVAGLPLSTASAQADPVAVLAAACTSCHGVDGRSTTAIPSLAGRPADDLAAALLAYRDGTRGGTIMDRIARGYTPEQIALLAAWFSAR